jgi:hypothetical protein
MLALVGVTAIRGYTFVPVREATAIYLACRGVA